MTYPTTLLRLLTIGLLLFLTSACKKTTDAVSARNCYISGIDYLFGNNFNVSYTYGYNSAGQPITARVTGLTSSSSTQEFTYTPGQITMKVNPVPTSAYDIVSAIYSLNSQGFITKVATTARTASSQTNTSNIVYEYNADGYLSKQIDSDGSYSISEYTNGLLTTGKDYSQSGQLVSTYTIDYLTDRTLPVPVLFLGNNASFYAAGLFGKIIRNPIKKSTSSVNGGSVYDYTYNSEGNITSSVTKTTPKSGTPSTFTTNYTYLCQ